MTETPTRCSLDDVIITDELARRPSRDPDYERESRALALLAGELADRPHNALQALTDLIVETGLGESAGISVLARQKGQQYFHWEALSGAWAGFKGGIMPFDASPCGVVVRRNQMLLFQHPERVFPDAHVEPLIHEILLVPFGGDDRDGKPAGTLWINAHGPGRKFDREDARLLRSLARFASAAHRMEQARIELVEAHEKLVETEKRQTFLLGLSDALRPLGAPSDVMRTATRILGEELAANRVFYANIDADGDTARVDSAFADGIPGGEGVYALTAFAPKLLSDWLVGRMTVIDDVDADSRFNDGERAAYASVDTRATMAAPLVKDGRLVAVLGVHHATPRAWTALETALLAETAERTWAAVERARAEAGLQQSQTRFDILAGAIDDVFYITDLDRGALDYVSPSYDKVWGRPRQELYDDLGRFAETIHPEDRAQMQRDLEDQAQGKAVIGHYRVIRPDGTIRHILDRSYPVPAGGRHMSAGVAMDVTERHLAMAELEANQERQKLLLAELQHRVRNILGMVRAMARQSLKPEQSAEDYLAHLLGRIDAIARTQVLVTRGPDVQVDLEGLVRDELLAHASDRDFATVTGPQVLLSPKAAEILTLTLHELATNSVKYGVLGAGEGSLAVRWELSMRDKEQWLVLRWHERGVTPLAPTEHTGFGTEIIERRMPYELRGDSSLIVEENGVLARIAFPLRDQASVLETGATGGLSA